MRKLCRRHHFAACPPGTAPRKISRLMSWQDIFLTGRSRKPFAFALAVIFSIPVFLCGCESAPQPVFRNFAIQRPPAPWMADYATNRLQEGDVVSITFQYSTNFDVTQKIGLDGMLNLESVGPVKAAGKTPVELQADVAGLYRPQIKDDVVTVKVIASVACVYVSGAVFHPGKVIMEAGGYDPARAKLSDVSVLRVEDSRQRVYRVDLKRALQGKADNPFFLKPFDVVEVPVKVFNY